MSSAQIKQSLTHHIRDGDNAKDAHERLNGLFLGAAHEITEIIPTGRGQSIIMRYLEDASIRAHHEVDQSDSPGHSS